VPHTPPPQQRPRGGTMEVKSVRRPTAKVFRGWDMHLFYASRAQATSDLQGRSSPRRRPVIGVVRAPAALGTSLTQQAQSETLAWFVFFLASAFRRRGEVM
jgi:hypothetical protein